MSSGYYPSHADLLQRRRMDVLAENPGGNRSRGEMFLSSSDLTQRRSAAAASGGCCCERGPTGPTGPSGTFGISGEYYSDYLFWNPIGSQWQVGSRQVHLGRDAGLTGQGDDAIAIGREAGNENQSVNGIAIGYAAGTRLQNNDGIAIGYTAGAESQGSNAIAIGREAGCVIQGEHSIAIGAFAGINGQATNSIILNATGSNLEADASGFYVAPLRDVSNGIYAPIRYDLSRNELVYSNCGVFGVGEVVVSSSLNPVTVSFPGMTSSGIVMLTAREPSLIPSVTNGLFYNCSAGSFTIRVSNMNVGTSLTVGWTVVKL